MKKVTKGSCELVLCQEIRYLDAMGEFPEPNMKKQKTWIELKLIWRWNL